jgi:DNA-binding transcriptional regulator LsrR (DeoR family)
MRVAEVPREAVIKRLNRLFSENGAAVKKARGSVADKLGYFLVEDGRIVRTNLNLERIAREHEVLEPYEVVA